MLPSCVTFRSLA